MPYTTYDHYLETEILSADPLKLVNLLYRGALEAVGAARRQLAAGEIRERSKSIVKAWELLQELVRSLDHTQAGDLSDRLSELYLYMQQRLIEANAQQNDAPLAEVEGLLATLADAWRSLSNSSRLPVAAAPAHPVRESLSLAY